MSFPHIHDRQHLPAMHKIVVNLQKCTEKNIFKCHCKHCTYTWPISFTVLVGVVLQEAIINFISMLCLFLSYNSLECSTKHHHHHRNHYYRHLRRSLSLQSSTHSTHAQSLSTGERDNITTYSDCIVYIPLHSQQHKKALNKCTVAFLFHSTFFFLFVLVRYVVLLINKKQNSHEPLCMLYTECSRVVANQASPCLLPCWYW